MKIVLILLTSFLCSYAGFSQFGPQQIISEIPSSLSFRVFSADLDGDGDKDILTASVAAQTVAWYENLDGLGSFSTGHVLISNLLDVRDAIAADIDNDGDLDVIATSGTQNIIWFKNVDGMGTFGAQQLISTEANATSIFAADVDGNGTMDIISGSFTNNTVAWYANDGLGNFGVPQIISTNAMSVNQVYAADINGDGDMDVIAAIAGTGAVAWYENLDGLGNFSAENVIRILAGGVTSIFAADLDGDGDIDVLSASQAGEEIAWYENLDGLGNFSSENIIIVGMGSMNRVYAADLDNDGDMDVISSSPNNFGNSYIAWYENLDGLGSFSSPNTITTEVDGPRDVLATDIDNDGDLDVVYASASPTDDKFAWHENLII
ncbi:MAG: hypothetical protein CVU03_12440, partial [Bacteroidetes bacterium HGW-Bacteroidetes-2]